MITILTLLQLYGNIITYESKKQKKENKSMETSHSGVEAVTMTEILGLNTWDRPRTTEDLQLFINRKHQELATVDVEDEELL